MLRVEDAFRLSAALWQIADPHVRILRELRRWDLVPGRRRRIGHLSAGEEHRVRLGVSLLANPTLWLLDQPFDDLDLRSRVTLETLVLNMMTNGAEWPGVEAVVMAGAVPEGWPGVGARKDVGPLSVTAVGRGGVSTQENFGTPKT
jgi:hypothetical protein